MNSLIKATSQLKMFFHNLKQYRKLTFFDLTLFFRQFATLLSAGISITQSCAILEKCQEKNALRLLIYSIKRHLTSGNSFYISLLNHPNHFDALTCHLIQIGEHTGKLDSILLDIAHHWEKNLQLQNRIKQALFYPGIISITAIFVTAGLMIFVIPKFAELFRDSDISLPVFTIIIFSFSHFMKQAIPYLIIAMIFMSVFLYQKKPSQTNRKLIKKIIYRIPFFRTTLHKMRLARFARNLSLTFAAGIPIINGLQYVTETSDAEFHMTLIKLRQKVSSGIQLHIAMAEFCEFPIMMIQMVKIGEESGLLDVMLNKSTEFLEADIEQFLRRFSQLLEPLIMVVLGVLIGGLVIGMYLPLFKLGNVI